MFRDGESVELTNSEELSQKEGGVCINSNHKLISIVMSCKVMQLIFCNNSLRSWWSCEAENSDFDFMRHVNEFKRRLGRQKKSNLPPSRDRKTSSYVGYSKTAILFNDFHVSYIHELQNLLTGNIENLLNIINIENLLTRSIENF